MTAQNASSRAAPDASAIAWASGLALASAVASAAYAARLLPGFASISPMIIAIGLGAALRNLVGAPDSVRPGLAFASRRLLRAAIVLLGFQLTVEQILSVGLGGLAAIAATLVATFLFTVRLGRLLGVDRALAQLIAAGTSICGASAVAATNAVARGTDEDVAYAVACVTLFGTIAMLAFPALGALLGLDAHAYGLWTGASIHEVAQVVAAGFGAGEAAGETATIAKLARVAMLAPLVLCLGAIVSRGEAAGASSRPPVPWFVLGFVAVIVLNSAVSIPAPVTHAASAAAAFLLTVALAAMGLETDVRKLRDKGLKPLALGFAASLFVAGFGLAMVTLLA